MKSMKPVGEALPRSAEWEVNNLSLKFARFAALSNQEQVFDGAGDGHIRPGFDQSGHRMTGLNARAGEGGEGGTS